MQGHVEAIICNDKPKPQGALQAYLLTCQSFDTSGVTSRHCIAAYGLNGLTAPDCSDA